MELLEPQAVAVREFFRYFMVFPVILMLCACVCSDSVCRRAILAPSNCLQPHNNLLSHQVLFYRMIVWQK